VRQKGFTSTHRTVVVQTVAFDNSRANKNLFELFLCHHLSSLKRTVRMQNTQNPSAVAAAAATITKTTEHTNTQIIYLLSTTTNQEMEACSRKEQERNGMITMHRTR
jgi:hypothetical protein